MFATGLAKLISSRWGHDAILEDKDPLMGISFRMLLFLAGLLELAVVATLIFSRRIGMRVALLAWLSTNFVAYRAGYFLSGFTHCPCLGTLTSIIKIPPNVADFTMTGILIYMVTASYTILFCLWKGKLR